MKRTVVLVALVMLVALLAVAGGIEAKGRPSSTVITAPEAATVLRMAADYIEETGAEPLDVEVFYDPSIDLWVTVVWP